MFESVFSNQWLLLFVAAASLLGAAEIGHRGGLNLYRVKDEARRSQIGGIQAAILGMLGLLLGFTFAMAVGRYDTRRNLVLKESNAIGTVWLRTSLLPEARRASVKDLLRRYVDVRLETVASSRDPAKLAEGLHQSADLQQQLWHQAEGAASDAPSPITVSFITSLNDMIDTDSERIAAARNQIPAEVWALLLIVAAAGCFTTSYGSGAQGARSSFTNLFLPCLIAVVTMVVFDLTHSQQGFIGISQQPLVDLQRSIQPKP